MCCFFASLLFVGPRLAFLVYWLLPIGRVKIYAAFSNWFVPLLGFIFLPWTILAYVIVFPVWGLFDYIIVGMGLFFDIMGYVGAYRNRRSVPYVNG